MDERLIQDRLFPKPGDNHYLHLSDLLLAVRKTATSDPLRVLDYGAGSSPYRSLFPKSQYLRADIASVSSAESGEAKGRPDEYPEPDYIILPDGRVPHESSAFDLVLSTQALEHVRETGTYLSEAFRLLKPGGKLFLTTHGSWHDHGDPYDFWRWTAYGLKCDLEEAGFEVLSIDKLTTGPRAVFMVYTDVSLDETHPVEKASVGIIALALRFIPTSWIHRQADQVYSNCRMVPSDASGHRISLRWPPARGGRFGHGP